jgi:uncharacterized iron-regulated protein
MLPRMNAFRQSGLILRSLVPGFVFVLAACAIAPPAALPSARVLIFGEQHDQPDQQRQVALAIRELAQRGELAAVVMEMVEQGHNTASLTRDADAQSVRDALAWSGWPWEVYADVVMSTVGAGVPLYGGNLPKAGQALAMTRVTLDDLLGDPVRELMRQAVRDGHCGLLPQAAEAGMVRIQIARDKSMAEVVGSLVATAEVNQRIVVLTGAQHAARDRGVPLHLVAAGHLSAGELRVMLFGDDQGLPADEHLPALYAPRPDPCEGLKKRLAAPRAPG